jgi:DNA mismatch repair protein MutS
MKEVRHPIIEIINEEIKYIANDVKLGKDNQDGILLYGMNSSGKSSLMKSIGLNIIMAQAGMYVPCKKMEYYPYNKIYSRIPGGDDLFRGQSTFVAEISEIRNILKSADSKTLVIGDELCSGTETHSATAIVSAGILDLIKKNSSFIFATHLHELADIDKIKNIEKLSIKHLSVEYIEDTNTIKFDRKLKEGSGQSIYGLEVCRSLDLDDDFMKMATNIRHEIMGTKYLLKNKKSKYNSKVIMDKCKICNKKNATETHHIRFQRDADENGFIDHFHKNKKFNLIGLCEECHIKIHNEELEICEAIQTTNGISYEI